MANRIAVVAPMLLLAACGGDGPSQPPGPAPPPPPPTATNSVDVNDNVFSPVAASIGASTAVTWTWRGGNQHNVTFEDGQQSSSTKATGNHQRSFPARGTFRYRCTIHSSSFDNGMVGRVVIQ